MTTATGLKSYSEPEMQQDWSRLPDLPHLPHPVVGMAYKAAQKKLKKDGKVLERVRREAVSAQRVD